MSVNGDRPLCGAKKRQGEGNCQKPAGWGTTHQGTGACRLHGGNTTAHQIAAARTAGERIAAVMEIEPHDALLHNLWAWNGYLHYLQDAVRGLEEEQVIVRSRRERSVRVDREDEDDDRIEYLTTVETSNEARLNVVVLERNIALQERGKAAKLCVDAKVEERQVTEMERRGALWAEAIGVLLDGFGLREDPRAPEVVRSAFRVLEGGKAA